MAGPDTSSDELDFLKRRDTRRARMFGPKSVSARSWALSGAFVSFGLALVVTLFLRLPHEVVLLALGEVLASAIVTAGFTLATLPLAPGSGRSEAHRSPRSRSGRSAGWSCWWRSAGLGSPTAAQVVSVGIVTIFVLWHLTTLSVLDAFVVFAILVIIVGWLLPSVAAPGRVRPVPPSPVARLVVKVPVPRTPPGN